MKVVQENLDVVRNISKGCKSGFRTNLESFWVKFDDWELRLEKLVSVNLQESGFSGFCLFTIENHMVS